MKLGVEAPVVTILASPDAAQLCTVANVKIYLKVVALMLGRIFTTVFLLVFGQQTFL